MSEQEIFAKKAENGYTICEAKQCRKKESCLLWKVGQNMPASVMCYTCVNQRYPDVATAKCPHYRKAEKVQMAKAAVTDSMEVGAARPGSLPARGSSPL